MRYLYKNQFTNLKNLIKLAALTIILSSSLSAQSFFYDGDRKVEIREEVGLLAEKTDLLGSSTTSEDASLVKRVDRSSTIVKNQSGIRIWKTSPIATKSSISKNYQISDVDSRYLPVYRNSAGNLLIPTGNMIVYFQEGMSDKQVKTWAAGKGLRAIEKLPLQTKNAWLIETPPGRKAIELANSAVDDGSVVSAMPNFWMEFSKK